MEDKNADKTAEKLPKAGGVPFKPGDDPRRNLEGRPKGSYSMVTLIKKKAEELYPGDPEKQRTYGEMVVEEMFKKAIGRADMFAIKEITDRIDGKAPASLDITSKGESINKVEVEIVNRHTDTETQGD